LLLAREAWELERGKDSCAGTPWSLSGMGRRSQKLMWLAERLRRAGVLLLLRLGEEVGRAGG
jgi:hypothetical protein